MDLFCASCAPEGRKSPLRNGFEADRNCDGTTPALHPQQPLYFEISENQFNFGCAAVEFIRNLREPKSAHLQVASTLSPAEKRGWKGGENFSGGG
jgi:hypothetical protein